MLNYRRVTIMFIVSACCRWKIPWNWRCHLAEAANHLSSGKPTKKRWKITISNGWINDFTISKRYITTRFTINVDPARYPIAILETIWRNQNRSPRLVKNFLCGYGYLWASQRAEMIIPKSSQRIIIQVKDLHYCSPPKKTKMPESLPRIVKNQKCRWCIPHIFIYVPGVQLILA